MSGTQGTFSNHNVRDLDRDEGAALHAHLFEEQMEWTEPIRKPSTTMQVVLY